MSVTSWKVVPLPVGITSLATLPEVVPLTTWPGTQDADPEVAACT